MTAPATDTQGVLRRLLELAAGRFARPPSELDATADMFDTLGIDSMDALELLTDLEQAFDVEIPDYEVQDVRTFQELAEVVATRL
jgi:acyl carrier protein